MPTASKLTAYATAGQRDILQAPILHPIDPKLRACTIPCSSNSTYATDCSSLNTIDASNNPIYTQRQAIAPEADIILAMHALCGKLADDGGDTKVQWIKAHQNDDSQTSDLSPSSQLNVDMDTVSKHSRINHAITCPTPYQGSGAMLIIGGQWIPTKYNEQIRDAMTAATHHNYFTKKYHITQATYDNIDWFGIGCACKSLPLSTNIHLTKMLHGLLNTGEQQAHMHQTGKCPCCAWP